MATRSMWRRLTRPGRPREWEWLRQRMSGLPAAVPAEPTPIPIPSSTTRDSAAQSLSYTLDPKECALLVLGCQPGVLDTVPDPSALLLKITSAVDLARLHGTQVIFIRISFREEDYQFAPMTNKEFAVLAREPLFRSGTPEAEIHPMLAAEPSDIVVRGIRLGAFSRTNLNEELTNTGITTLIVVGAHTSGALLTSIREAAELDYRLIILEDCVADRDSEVHEFLMTRVFPRQAEITTAADLHRAMVTAQKEGRGSGAPPLTARRPVG